MRTLMLVMKRTIPLPTVVAVAMVLSPMVMAQTSGAKSTPAATVDEGDAFMIGKTGAMHKSNTKVSAAKHTAAMAKGAREIPHGTVIYKQGGKFYMLEEPSRQTFQDVFENF